MPKKRKKRQLESLLADVNKVVKAYPPIDVHEERRIETPKGEVVRMATRISAILIVGSFFYGALMHDREIILATLNFATSLLLVLLGLKVIERWRPETSHDDEEDKGSR